MEKEGKKTEHKNTHACAYIWMYSIYMKMYIIILYVDVCVQRTYVYKYVYTSCVAWAALFIFWD